MKKLFLFIAAVMCAASVVWAQEIATWPKFRKGAATFTFDDGAPSHIADVAPLFDRFGYKATFYVVVNWAGVIFSRLRFDVLVGSGIVPKSNKDKIV